MTVLAAPTSLRRSSRRTLADRYWLLLALVLLGYALAGKGFAYVGIPPLYVGEVCLLVGLVVLLLARGWMAALRLPQTLMIVPFALWGVARMVPFVSEYGI